MYPATVLSDGTLRFAAITAALLSARYARHHDNSKRLKTAFTPVVCNLLLELLREPSRIRAQTQVVMATTHSATVLDWLLEDKDYGTTFFCGA